MVVKAALLVSSISMEHTTSHSAVDIEAVALEHLLSSEPPIMQPLSDPKVCSEQIAASPTNSGLSPPRTGSRNFSEHSQSWRSNVDPNGEYYGAATAESPNTSPITSPGDTPAEVLSKWFPPGKGSVFGSLPDVSDPEVAVSPLPKQSAGTVGSEMIPVPGGIVVPQNMARYGATLMAQPARRDSLLKSASWKGTVSSTSALLSSEDTRLPEDNFVYFETAACLLPGSMPGVSGFPALSYLRMLTL